MINLYESLVFRLDECLGLEAFVDFVESGWLLERFTFSVTAFGAIIEHTFYS